MQTKICNKCKQEKSLSDFYKDKTKKDGYRNQCKYCEGNKGKCKPITQIDGEIWKDIKGYEDKYQVSNLGRIKRIDRNIEIIGSSNSKGYLAVKLTMNGICKTKTIHRLVAETFIPNFHNKSEVDHINTVRTDNRVQNLRWVTHKENCNNPISKKHYSAMRIGKPNQVWTEEQRKSVSERMKGFKHTEDTKKKMSVNRSGSKNARALNVYQFSLNGEFIKEWKFVKEASIELKICYTSIINCCKGRQKTAGGFKWAYDRNI